MPGLLTGILIVGVALCFVSALLVTALSAASIPFNYGRRLRHRGVNPWKAARSIGKGASVVWLIFLGLSILAILAGMIGI